MAFQSPVMIVLNLSPPPLPLPRLGLLLFVIIDHEVYRLFYTSFLLSCTSYISYIKMSTWKEEKEKNRILTPTRSAIFLFLLLLFHITAAVGVKQVSLVLQKRRRGEKGKKYSWSWARIALTREHRERNLEKVSILFQRRTWRIGFPSVLRFEICMFGLGETDVRIVNSLSE